MAENRLQTAEDLEDAFHALNEVLFRYVYIRYRNREHAEDIVQEAFVKAWRKRDTYDSSKSSLKTWLFKITTNTMFDALRQQKRRPSAELKIDIPSQDDVSAEVAKSDLVEYLFDRVKDLSPREQELLFLRYREGMAVKDITAAVRKSGYKTKNKTLDTSVGIALAEMKNAAKLRRGVYRLN